MLALSAPTQSRLIYSFTSVSLLEDLAVTGSTILVRGAIQDILCMRSEGLCCITPHRLQCFHRTQR